MEDCSIYLERKFFEKFFLEIDLLENFSHEKEGDKMAISIIPIHWYDFYVFNTLTSMFIGFLVIIMALILIYIGFSKLYLKRVINRLKLREIEQYEALN